MNRPTTNKKIESLFKDFSIEKSQGLEGSTSEFY